MKKIIYYLIPFMVMPISIYAQFICANDDIAPPSVNSVGAGCSSSPNYTPDDLTQTKNVRITIHVVQDDNGLNNFQDTPTERDWLINTMVGNMNWVMRTLQPMNLSTTSAYIQDSKIQFIVDDIFFHQSTYLWDFSMGMSPSLAYTKGYVLYDQYVTNNPIVVNKTNSIHVFLVDVDSLPTQGRACGIGCNDWTLIGNTYQNYLNGGNFWIPAGLLRHELGHNLGLIHSWDTDNCGDTPSNSNCWNGPTCSNNLMDYNAGQNAITECQLANMHYYLSNGNGKDVVTNYCETNNNLIIDNNSINTWYNSRYIQGDLIIKNNSTLVVTCEVYMPNDSKIIIEKGGKLIVDGGIITNKCDGMWQGIEVRGNSTASQATLGAQGKLEIRNGALIENCYSIYTGEHDATGQIVWGTFGGIIQIDNSTLKNNRSGVEFGPYQNYYPPVPSFKFGDFSYIRNSQFIWDDSGNMTTLGIAPYSFIGLWETHGVGIQGNTFKNEYVSGSPNYQKGVGIIAYDADFKVLPSCSSFTFPCPSSSTVPNTFESLNYAIKAHGINSVARVIVDGNVFTNNRYGVGLLATTYASVIRNTFRIPISNIPIEDGGDAIGIYTTGSYGYNFEENLFSTWGIGPSWGSNYGIVSDNSSLSGGLVYRNEFDNLIVANLNSQDNTGLKIDCNSFTPGTLNRYDMAITSGNLSNQGACASFSTKPAKNSFNSGCSGEENIFHYPSGGLIYSALSADLPSCITTPEVFNIPCGGGTLQNLCTSNISNPVAPSELVAKIDANKTTITNLQEQFDGGNQSGLLSAINSMSNGQVKNELLAASPYLSDKVLVSFLKKSNPLPAGHIKQIIVANSPVAEKVKQTLDAVALPNGIRNQIEAVQTGVSARQVLENEIKQLEIENQLMKNEYIRQCLDSQLVTNAKDFLNNGNLCSDKASLLPIVVKEDLSRTDQLIGEIRDEVSIIRDEIPNCPKAATLEKICDFYDEVKTKIASTGSFNITTAADEQNIRAMASKTGATAINAQNALSLFKGENIERFAEPIILTPNNARLLQPQTSPNSYRGQTGVDYKLNNYPNPFNESTVIEATIPENTSGEIIITDVTGKQVQRVVLSTSKNKVELQGNELGYGIFFYSLYINSEYIQTKKLTRIQ